MQRRIPARLMLAACLVFGVVRPVAADQDPVDYVFRPLSGGEPARALPAPKYRFMFGAPARWPGGLRWRYNHADAPATYATAQVAVADLQRTFDAWTLACGVTHVYEGETTTLPNTRVGDQPDYVNVVGWSQLQGGTAGLTYAWYRTDVGMRELVDADIILSPTLVRGYSAMERAGRHEWGHAIGLAHSDRPGMLMSGPPLTEYSGSSDLRSDDIRGCRCLYGPAASHPAGYACSIPSAIDMGAVPVGAPSAPHLLTVTNDGNAPLVIAARSVTRGPLRLGEGCEPGSSLPGGASCTVSLVADAQFAGEFAAEVVLDMSDGQYVVAVSFRGVSTPPVALLVDLVEYFHPGFGHYFVTSIADEIHQLDDGSIPGWQRTARTMRAWAQAPGLPPTVPVCRFFSARFAPKSSHFYTASVPECAGVMGSADWLFEGNVFHVALPDATGTCASGTQAIYRLYNDGLSGAPNHRFTTDAALRGTMIGQGWTPEGAGLGVTMCGAP